MERTPSENIIILRDIRAGYGGIEALKGVDFELARGEVHALVGEHRAGKSTLIKVISGALKKNGGKIVINGKQIDELTPRSALRAGIATVYQNMNIVPTLNAGEFIHTGRMPFNAFGFMRRSEIERETEALLKRFGIDIDVRVPLGAMPEDKQLMVELMKAVSVDPDVIIFDEISNKLTPEEMETVYRILIECKRAGKSAIYISHNFDEILTIADRVTILKDGIVSGTEDIANLDRGKLIKMAYSFVMTREELNQNNRELLYLKKYNETVIRNLPLGMIILDAQNRVYLINAPALKMTGWNEESARGASVERLFDTAALPLAHEIADKVRSREEGFWREASDGKGAVYRIASYPFNDGDVTFWGTILMIEDITRERFLNDYLIRTEKIASVSELAASVAHEINNPIGICLNYLELLDRRVEGDDNRVKIGKVRGELNRISEIVKGLLSFAKIKNSPHRVLDVSEPIEDVVLLMRSLLDKRNIEIEWMKPVIPVLVRGDESRLKQVILNLIKNSMEAIGENGRVSIHVRTDDEKNTAEISVTDDGPGIPQEIRDKIFDPFFSTKNNKSNTGLGLSICQHIIEAHQGIIECRTESRVTTMSVKLPLVLEEKISERR